MCIDNRIFYLFQFSNASPNKIIYASEDMRNLLEIREKQSLPLVLGWANSWDEFHKDSLNKGGVEII